jgi:hypothetical protein
MDPRCAREAKTLTLVLLAAVWPGSDGPLTPQFWFRMSLATVFGAVIAFPINR